MLQLRPHHLLCALAFQGKGYSPVFIKNMRRIVNRLRARGGDQVRIKMAEGLDPICAPCPYRLGNVCEKQGRTSRLDAAHAEALLLAPGDVLTWGEAKQRIVQRVSPAKLQKICKGCAWLSMGMCTAALHKLHNAPKDKGGKHG